MKILNKKNQKSYIMNNNNKDNNIKINKKRFKIMIKEIILKIIICIFIKI